MKIYSKVEGPIYVVWNTNHEDQSAINAANLTSKLPENFLFNWKKKVNDTPGQLLYFFKKEVPGLKQEVDIKKEVQVKKEVQIKKEEPKEEIKKRHSETQSKSSPKKQKTPSDLKNVKPLTSYFCK
jgi:hypothetical protein